MFARCSGELNQAVTTALGETTGEDHRRFSATAQLLQPLDGYHFSIRFQNGDLSTDSCSK